jgi:hypothetical protein
MSSRKLVGRTALMVLGLAMLTAISAAAQRAQAVEISGFGGWYFGSQIYQGTPSGGCEGCNGPITVNVNSSGLWGARLGYDVSRTFGVEFSWSGTSPGLSFNGAGASGLKGSININNYDFDAMFNFGQQRVWGYLALGIGWSSFNPSVTFGGVPQDISSQDYFSGNTALGMKAFINPHLYFRFDARYRWTSTNHQTSSGVGCYYYCYGYSSNYYGAGELTGGLTYVAFK